MSSNPKFRGAVVPLVTPIRAEGQLDYPALERLVETQIAAGVEGLLLLGTTGEGPCVPRNLRRPLVEHVIATVRKRLRIFVNVIEHSLADTLAGIRDFFTVGADAIVVLPPSYFPPSPAELLQWFRTVLDGSPGPVLLYNIPLTTHLSIPLDVFEGLAGHPRFAGLKDSDHDAQRQVELLRRFGGRSDLSVFVGVGSLMARGLQSGADGIVPSVGNLIPRECQRQIEAARRQDWETVQHSGARQLAVASVYQKGRSLAQSLAALKGLLHLRGFCSPAVFPPLLPCAPADLDGLRGELEMLQLG